MERIGRVAVVMGLVVALVSLGGLVLAAEHAGEEHGGQGQAAPAQREPTPEELQQANAMMEQMMVPMMGQMMSVMLESMASKLAEPQIAQNLATFTRNFYLALKDRGFSEEEAIRIVTSAGFPAVGGKQ